MRRETSRLEETCRKTSKTMTMTLTPAVLSLLVCLVVLQAEGQRHAGSSCKCLDGGVDRVNPRLVEKFEMFPVSNSCRHFEIIAILKNGGKKCLNPNSKFSQHYIGTALKSKAKKHQSHPSTGPHSNTTSVSNTTSAPALR